jgi:hypothetical protein
MASSPNRSTSWIEIGGSETPLTSAWKEAVSGGNTERPCNLLTRLGLQGLLSEST